MIKRFFVLLLLIGFTASCSTFESFLPSPHVEGRPVYVASSACALPCFYGMTPGETPYTRALAYIASLPSAQFADERNFWIPGNNQNKINVSVRRYDPREPDITDTIELATYDATPILSLGQFIDSGWKPTHIYRIRASLSIVLLLVFGDHGQIIAEVVDDNSINADSSINNLFLVPAQDSKYYLDYIRTVRLFDNEIAWLGYASAEDYRSEAPIH